MGEIMKFKWIKSNRSIIKFLLMLLIISTLIGIYFYLSKEKIIKESINTELIKMIDNLNITRQNNIINHLLILIILSVLSLTIIGLPIIIIYFIYEGISIGFLLSSFINYSPIKGFLFGSIFIIISKTIYILILIYLLTNTLKYTKSFIKRLKISKNDIITNQLAKTIFCITIILINDIILYFLGNKIILLFKFIL